MNSRVVEEASGAVGVAEKASEEEVEFFFRAYEESLLPAVLVIRVATDALQADFHQYYVAKYGFYREPRFLCRSLWDGLLSPLDFCRLNGLPLCPETRYNEKQTNKLALASYSQTFQQL